MAKERFTCPWDGGYDLLGIKLVFKKVSEVEVLSDYEITYVILNQILRAAEALNLLNKDQLFTEIRDKVWL